MAITRQKKEEIVKKAQDIIKDSESVVFVNFHGLSVAETTELRRALREAGVNYVVLKKSLVQRVLASADVEGEVPDLDGELALASAKDDAVAPARGVYQFAKSHDENLAILGGIFENRFMGKEEMVEIASIPPVEILYGKFANIVNSPIQRFTVALGQIAEAKA